MRVVHVVRQFSPSVGGIEDVVLNLARQQRENYGIDARVVTLDRVFWKTEPLPAQEMIAGIPVTRLRWWGSPRYPLAPRVLQEVKGADLVHVHAIDFFVDFLALTWPLHRIPMLVATHGGIFHTDKQASLKRLWFQTVTRLSLRAYRAVVADSDNDARLFKPLSPRRMLTIENGVALDKLRAPPGSVAIRTDPRRILCLGRFAPHKRVASLFPLLAALRRHSPDWTLVLAGVEWGETAASLQAQAEAAGVGGAVRIVVGLPDPALAEEASQATYFASASAFEGFGVAAVEAVAAGLIPILSRIPTYKRLAETLPASVLFDPDTPDQAARDIIKQDAALAGRHGEIRTAMAASVARFDWVHAARSHVELYQALLDRTVPSKLDPAIHSEQVSL